MLTPDGSFTSAETLQRSRLLLNGADAEIVRVQLHDDAHKTEAIEAVALIEGDEGLVYSIALRCAPEDFVRLEPVFQRAADSWHIRPDAARSRRHPHQSATPSANPSKPNRIRTRNENHSRDSRNAGRQSRRTSSGSEDRLRSDHGRLHEGHVSLVRARAPGASLVVVSIFVNPLQFGPAEDFNQYPRTLEADCARLEGEGVGIVFAPSAAEMYPAGATTVVHVEGLSDRLDGRSRPGHFRGVSTVVAKLFHIVQPDYAVFGQKDAAQVAVLRRMVRDLNMDLELIVAPIVREADGLALSSRNAYLTAEQRGRRWFCTAHCSPWKPQPRPVRRAEKLRSAALAVLASEPAAKLDYFEIIDPDTLEAVGDISQGALAAVAASFGSTRLIDNLLLSSSKAD